MILAKITKISSVILEQIAQSTTCTIGDLAMCTAFSTLATLWSIFYSRPLAIAASAQTSDTSTPMTMATALILVLAVTLGTITFGVLAAYYARRLRRRIFR